MTKQKYSKEVRERAVRMVREHQPDHLSEWATIQSVAAKLGCTPQTLHNWVRKAQVDAGQREGLSTSDRERKGTGA
jgi:transposase-like protein